MTTNNCHEQEGLISMTREYFVNQCLPNDGQRVLCFGHKTFCCDEDMDDSPSWHEVTFKMIVSEYKLKDHIPNDPLESILDYYKVHELWDASEENDIHSHIIGTTRWKEIN